jgi:hypothetical protein
MGGNSLRYGVREQYSPQKVVTVTSIKPCSLPNLDDHTCHNNQYLYAWSPTCQHIVLAPFQYLLPSFQLNINTILVKGSCNPDLLSVCLSHHIAVLENIPYKILHAISMATDAAPLSYITDATKVN